MKKVMTVLARVLLWTMVLACSVELLSFLVITASNFILYGHPREGSRASYDPYTFFLMKDGVRPTAFNSRSPDPGLNRTVWLFGGSTLRSDTREDEKTIPSLMSRMLNEEAQPLHFTLVNFGVNSFNSLLETKYLQKMLIESDQRPDLIIFYDGANDTNYFSEYGTPYGHHGYRRARALVEGYYESRFGLLKPLNAAFYSSFTHELWHKIHKVLIPIEEDSPLLKEMVDKTEQRYDHVNKLARCFGADFLVIWQPMLWVEDSDVPEHVKQEEKSAIVASERFASVRHNFSVIYRALAERLKKKPYFVSFQGALNDRKAPAYKADGVHLRDAGREMIARKMVLVLKVRNLLKTPRQIPECPGRPKDRTLPEH